MKTTKRTASKIKIKPVSSDSVLVVFDFRKTGQPIFKLELPRSLWEQISYASKKNGITTDQFIRQAVNEKFAREIKHKEVAS